MALIGITSDPHLCKTLGTRTDAAGVNRRSIDIERAFSEVVDGFIRARVSVAVIAGDLFDMPRPPERVRQFVLRELQRLRAALPDVRIVILRGNHDSPGALADATAIGTTGMAVDGVTVIDRAQVEQVEAVPGVVLTCVPWMRSGPEFLAAVERLEPVEGAKNFAFLHCGLSSLAEYAAPDSDEQVLTPGLVPQGFDWTFVGHYHHYRVFPDLRLTFIGSPERMSVSESDSPKGFLILDTDTGVADFRPVAARTWYDTGIIDAAGWDGDRITAEVAALEASLPDWGDALVRVRIRNVAPEVYAGLDMLALRAIGARAWHDDISILAADTLMPSGEEGERRDGAPLLDDLGSEWDRHMAASGRDAGLAARIAQIGAAALGGENAKDALARIERALADTAAAA
jgi:DNA repair exonuclease SbcCD nuclease subunit